MLFLLEISLLHFSIISMIKLWDLDPWLHCREEIHFLRDPHCCFLGCCSCNTLHKGELVQVVAIISSKPGKNTCSYLWDELQISTSMLVSSKLSELHVVTRLKLRLRTTDLASSEMTLFLLVSLSSLHPCWHQWGLVASVCRWGKLRLRGLFCSACLPCSQLVQPVR